MRRILIALLGAMILQLGVVTAAVASDDSTTSSSDVTTSTEQTTPSTDVTSSSDESTTSSEESTTTSSTEESTTTSTTEQATTTTEQPAPGTVFARSPASGPVGTVIDVHSVDNCPVPEESGSPSVEVVMFNDHDIEQGEATIDEVFDVAGDGSWSGKLTVPADAALGAYVLDAACFSSDSDVEPSLLYQPLDFTVTQAPSMPPSPPASPTPGNPLPFTG